MSDHVKQLEPKIRKIQNHINRMAEEDTAETIFQIIHRPGWTTLPEVNLVTAVLDSLTQQLEGVDRTHKELASIADQIGRKETASKVA